MNIAIRPDGSWWDIDEDGAEGDCDDVMRVVVPAGIDEDLDLVDAWAAWRAWPGSWGGENEEAVHSL